jgi:hypothetical protein
MDTEMKDEDAAAAVVNYAYETCDVIAGELYTVESKYRRAMLAATSHQSQLVKVRQRVNVTYSAVDRLLRHMRRSRFKNRVDSIVKSRGLAKRTIPPVSIAYLYYSDGASELRCFICIALTGCVLDLSAQP